MIPEIKNTIHVLRPVVIWRIFIKSIIFVLIPITFLHLTLIIASDKVPAKQIAFQPGEKLIYKGKWGIIPAGEVTLEVLPKETIKGNEVYHFVMMTKTSAAVDLVYKIRERQDSYVDIGMTHSIFYKKKTESPHPRNESINFNWEKGEATYTNFGQNKPPIRILPGTFDPLALFYAIRLRTLKENSEIHLPLTDGNNLNIEVRAIIGKKDVIEIEGIMYDTIEVTPDMGMLDELDKVVKKSDHPQLKIWVTADGKKIPVRIRSQVGILSFNFDLVPGPL
ncbi:MAG TPA: DUF3108 domain-containing protein [Flexilinea sp.]|nr:DUF3108 domain-containing protein [Flexilinea sp.]